MLAFRSPKVIALCLQLKKPVVESTYLTVCVNKCSNSVIVNESYADTQHGFRTLWMVTDS